jgi:hypothetical protein
MIHVKRYSAGLLLPRAQEYKRSHHFGLTREPQKTPTRLLSASIIRSSVDTQGNTWAKEGGGLSCPDHNY